ncbi:synaptonemal complex central element protein 1 isoform X2 [Phoca vitulina]|uniref:synaptonemal complex central element protein 1 isoform X2 n=1 Tax=Phoca vitulina TaxID=9720 RepID=UPI0013961BFF|nr:synaptonemal complex central element protein 1 isoform X2 [Phoca vitulina]
MHPAPTSSTRNVRPPRLKACALAPLHSRWDPVHRSRKRGAQACCRKPRPGREFRPIHTEVLLAGRARAEKMAGRSGPSDAEGAGATERAEKAGGQAKSSQKIEDLLEMVKKLQKAGSLEPRVEVLINRINEVQQAKKKASEELGEARTVWEALQREMDSLSGEKVRLKEILNKKQETLRILRLHCQEKESEAQRKQTMLQECKERISALNSQIEEEKNKQRQLRLDFEEQLEDLMGQHKDLWKFHRPEQMAREIGTLDSSKEQLLKEGEAWRMGRPCPVLPRPAHLSLPAAEKLVEAKLEDVKHRLCSQFGADGCSTIAEGLFLRSQEAAAAVHLFEEENRKAQELLEAAAHHHEQLQQKCQQLQQKRQRLKEELEKLGMQIPAQAPSKQEEGAGPGEPASPKLLGVIEEKDPELPTKQGPLPS